MKQYQVEITRGAGKQLAALSPKDSRRIDRLILSLEGNPRPPGCKKLKFERDLYRLRHGFYRIIYRVNDELLLVRVLRVMHRRDVYR